MANIGYKSDYELKKDTAYFILMVSYGVCFLSIVKKNEVIKRCDCMLVLLLLPLAGVELFDQMSLVHWEIKCDTSDSRGMPI